MIQVAFDSVKPVDIVFGFTSGPTCQFQNQ